MKFKDYFAEDRDQIFKTVFESSRTDPETMKFLERVYFKELIFEQLDPELRTNYYIDSIYDIFHRLDFADVWMDSKEIIRKLCIAVNKKTCTMRQLGIITAGMFYDWDPEKTFEEQFLKAFND